MDITESDEDLTGQGFGIWLERLQRDLRGIAFRLVRNAPDAADLLQATCLRALEKRHLFIQGTVADLRNWLIKIMRNLYLDGVRRGALEVLIDRLEDTAAPDPTPIPCWKMVDERALWSAIRQLSPALREVYQLLAIERLPYAAISSRLSIPIVTVATRVHRARACLRRILTATTAEMPPAVASAMLRTRRSPRAPRLGRLEVQRRQRRQRQAQ